MAVVLLAGLCCVGIAHAVGLGGINVLSRLGQPFAADIALINASRDDLASLKVNLAPPAAYEAANLKFDPALNALRLSVERRPNGTPYIRATSTRPVKEPYLDVLVELTTQDGKFQRAYSALLDLPDTATPVAVAPSAVAGAVATPPRAESATVSPRASETPRRAARPPAANDTGKAVALAPQAPLPATRSPVVPGNSGLAPAVPKAAEPVVRPDAAKPAALAPAPAPAPASPPAAAEPPKADLPKPVLGEAEKVAVAESPLPAAKKAVVPPPTPPQAGATDAGSNQGLLLGGAALALLAGLGGLWAWRRRSAAPEPVVAPVERTLHPEIPAPGAGIAVAVAHAGRGTTAAAVVADSQEFTRSGPTVASVTDSVDPIDEAKVHLDYGQRERAETILREALSKQPGREDIQLLLLEVLAARGDTDGFNQLAGRIHKQTGGLGDHWKQVMSMGYALDPGYALYSPTDAAPASQAQGNLGGAVDLQLDERDAGIDMEKTMVLARPGTRPAAPVPDNLGVAADLELDERDAGNDLDKTMVLARPGTRPTAPAIAPLPDMNFELPPVKAPSAAAIPDITLDAPRAPDHPGLDFKVDLPGIALLPDIAVDTAAAPADNNAQHEEVQKKLMLARAYREMGDKEGALELLREVEREGDSTQLAEMREILQTLS